MSITVGDVEQISVRFYDSDGQLADPGSVTLDVVTPLGTTTSYTYGVSVALERQSRGWYTLDQTATMKGHWKYTWTATGGIVDTLLGSFDVDPNVVPVQVSVEDEGGTPIVGAIVTLFMPDGLTIQAGGTTNTSGTVALYTLPDITYQVEIMKTGSIVKLEGEMTVLDQPSQPPFLFEVSALTITPFIPPLRTYLYGYVMDLEGAPADARIVVEVVGYRGRAWATGGQGVLPDNVAVLGQRRELITDVKGFWGLSVLRGATIRVTVQGTRFEKVFRVPDDVSQLNIRDARGDAGPGGEVGISADVPTFDPLRGVS